MKSFEIHTDRQDIRQAAVVEKPVPVAGPGQAVLAVEGFALTTNNVTYAATGDDLGYWKFFPTGVSGQGIVPVWGFARVVESTSAVLQRDERLYGFFPMAGHMVITPEPRGGSAVVDAAAHRAGLPVVYNRYTRVTAPEDAARRAIFQPLLVTSWLLYDFLADNGWFGAEQVIIGSASSKTGLGLAKFLAEARPGGPEEIGRASCRERV